MKDGALTMTTVDTTPPVPEAMPNIAVMREVQTGKLLVDLNKAAHMLSCSKRTIERERERGNLRCRRLGGRWRIEVSELHRYIKNLKTA
jgi:excisionase family DNA binding protein